MPKKQTQAWLTFALLICGTIIGLAGIDLVLPAIPSLPNHINGSLEGAQLVLASFAAGTAFSLLIFGELGARFNQRILLIGALTLYANLSFLAALCESINQLITVRFFQGLASSAPAVFAPGMIKAMFDEKGALKAIGLMGSIESLTPAFAPVIGAWLLTFADWRASFFLTTVLALALATTIFFIGSTSLKTTSKESDTRQGKQGYLSLFSNREFLRQGLSHACTLGGLLIFVFGAPTVITISMNGSLSTFVIMQLIGISLFVVSANLSGQLVAMFGHENMILFGSTLTALGCILIALFAIFGNNDPTWLWLLFAPVNLGLGLRGPPGFYQAVVASGNNDSRGAALLILFILGVAAIGTAAVSQFISLGLQPLSLASAFVSVSSLILLIALKKQKVPYDY